MSERHGRFGDSAVSRSADDALTRRPVVTALAELLTDARLQTPLTIGIFGEWGSGKTSTMRLLEERIEAVGHSTVWFDAWHFAHQREALWRALLLAVIEKLRHHLDARSHAVDPAADDRLRTELDRAEVALYRSHEYQDSGNLRVNWKTLVPLAVETTMALLPLGTPLMQNIRSLLGKKDTTERAMQVLERQRVDTYREQILSLEQFQSAMRAFVLQVYGPDSGRKLYVFIDDLDRCMPQAAVDALEALKVFLDIPGCVFVFGIDRRVVEAGVRLRHLGAGGDPDRPEPVYSPAEYLEKLVQIPFSLPPLSSSQLQDLVDDWSIRNEDSSIDETTRQIILAGVAANPRKVKRTLNVLWLATALRAQTAGYVTASEMQLLAKLTVLQTSFDGTYQRVKSGVRALKAMEAAELRPQAPDTAETAGPEDHRRLRRMLSLGARFGDVPDDVVAQLLSASVVGDAAPPTAEGSRQPP